MRVKKKEASVVYMVECRRSGGPWRPWSVCEHKQDAIEEACSSILNYHHESRVTKWTRKPSGGEVEEEASLPIVKLQNAKLIMKSPKLHKALLKALDSECLGCDSVCSKFCRVHKWIKARDKAVASERKSSPQPSLLKVDGK